MKKGFLLTTVIVCLVSGTVFAKYLESDVFKGKLFAPQAIMQQRAALDLTKDQYTAIRAAVVEVQSGIAEYEWDMREAYQAVMLELDKAPIDEAIVMQQVKKALLAENQIKTMQMTMLIRLKNLLNDEQIAYLEAQDKEK